MDDDVVAAVGVPSILERSLISKIDLKRSQGCAAYSVLGWVLALTGSRDGDVREQDIGAVGDPVVVLRAVAEVQVLDSRVVQADSTEEDRSENVYVLSIQIIPDLAVAVKETTTIDVHIISTELEECGGVLEDLLESVRLPVVCVVGELDVTLNIEIDMVEVGQVQCCTDHVLLTLGENDMTAVVAFVDGRKDVVRVISHAVVVRANITDSVSGRRRRERLEGLLGRDVGLRACSLVLGNALWQGLGVFLLSRPRRRSNGCDSAQKSRSKEWLEQHLLDACKRDRDENEIQTHLKTRPIIVLYKCIP